MRKKKEFEKTKKEKFVEQLRIVMGGSICLFIGYTIVKAGFATEQHVAKFVIILLGLGFAGYGVKILRPTLKIIYDVYAKKKQ